MVGPTAEIVAFFGSFNFICPSNYNPSDYVMYISQTQSLEALENAGIFAKNEFHENEIKLLMASQLPGSPMRNVNGQSIRNVDMSDVPVTSVVAVSAPMYKQIYWLSYREYLNVTRDVASLAGRFGVTVILNLLFGLIFLGAGSKSNSDPTNFGAHFGAITMTTIASMFGSAQPVMLAFPYERPLFMREYSTGTCRSFLCCFKACFIYVAE
jgi:hypothetical protein